MRPALILAALAALPALAACGEKSAEPGAERKSAAGEVLGGEVSDAMLPLDTVRSTSPAGRSEPGDADAGPRAARSGPAAADNAADVPSSPEAPDAAPAPSAPASPTPAEQGA